MQMVRGKSSITNLTAKNADHVSAPLSPDGSKIAFASPRALDGSDAVGPNGTKNIWVVNVDGTSPLPLIRLTASGADSDGPLWSPDGTKLVFVSAQALDGSDAANTNSTQNIWIVNSDGTNAKALTRITAAASSGSPWWSPDGSKVVFDSARALDGSDSANGTRNIWVVNVDGSGATPLTKLVNGGASVTPQWRR